MTETFDSEKAAASAWFRQLRDDIVSRFEAIEAQHEIDAPCGTFTVTPTQRTAEDGSDAGGGLMSVMRGGRVFEKVGVNVSTVFGTLGARAQEAMAARKGIPGMRDDPRFWAAGISLVAHMQNPHCPAVHMNTRMFWTPHAWWFGGGSDLNPCIEYAEDTAQFHGVLNSYCARMGQISIRATRLGRMNISIFPTASARAVWAAFSMMITAPAIGRKTLRLPKMSDGHFCRPMRHWSKRGLISRGARRNATPN